MSAPQAWGKHFLCATFGLFGSVSSSGMGEALLTVCVAQKSAHSHFHLSRKSG